MASGSCTPLFLFEEDLRLLPPLPHVASPSLMCCLLWQEEEEGEGREKKRDEEQSPPCLVCLFCPAIVRPPVLTLANVMPGRKRGMMVAALGAQLKPAREGGSVCERSRRRGRGSGGGRRRSRRGRRRRRGRRAVAGTPFALSPLGARKGKRARRKGEPPPRPPSLPLAGIRAKKYGERVEEGGDKLYVHMGRTPPPLSTYPTCHREEDGEYLQANTCTYLHFLPMENSKLRLFQ